MKRGILAALALTLLSTGYLAMQGEDGDADDAVVEVKAARPGVTTAVAQAPSAAGDGIAPTPERGAATVTQDLFAAHSFLPPPPRLSPEEAAALKPPPPMAPPLPFRYQGRMVEGNSTVVFLAQGDRMLVARKGDLLNNQYRVESVSANAITFVYEPLNQRQTLSIGSAK